MGRRHALKCCPGRLSLSGRLSAVRRKGHRQRRDTAAGTHGVQGERRLYPVLSLGVLLRRARDSNENAEPSADGRMKEDETPTTNDCDAMSPIRPHCRSPVLPRATEGDLVRACPPRGKDDSGPARGKTRSHHHECLLLGRGWRARLLEQRGQREGESPLAPAIQHWARNGRRLHGRRPTTAATSDAGDWEGGAGSRGEGETEGLLVRSGVDAVSNDLTDSPTCDEKADRNEKIHPLLRRTRLETCEFPLRISPGYLARGAAHPLPGAVWSLTH